MDSNGKSSGSVDLNTGKSSVTTDVSSTGSINRNVQPSSLPINHSVEKGFSSSNPVSGGSTSKKLKGKAVVSSDQVLFFNDVDLGPHEEEVRFRLIHFWEARNPLTKTLIGLEMLLIDEQGTVIQGFIPPGRIDTYLPHMVPGSIYRLTKFYGSKSKIVYRVAEPNRFRFHGYEEFEADCGLKRDLYDFIGHMKLVNEQPLSDGLVLDEAEIASTRRVLLHVQTHGGPLLKLYLWDKVATDFCEKFKAHGQTPVVILVTTVNPKRFGGALSISSLASSRVFLDMEVQPTRDYFIWLAAHLDVANGVDAGIVTKTESVSIGELISYMKQGGAKVAFFECTATIDDVVRGSTWYYIACAAYKTKATKGPTTLMCKKCGKAEVTGVAKYLTKISVYDNNDQAFFILLGDAGHDLTGKQASQLVESYFEANDGLGDEHIVPVPQALIDTIGQTRKFIVKVSDHNLTGKTQALTVTKVLRLEAPEHEGNVEKMDDEHADETDVAGDELVKRSSAGIDLGGGKRAKRG